MADAVVYRVIIKKPEGDQVLTTDQFLQLSPVDQTDLILENKVMFVDSNWNPIPSNQGIKSLKK